MSTGESVLIQPNREKLNRELTRSNILGIGLALVLLTIGALFKFSASPLYIYNSWVDVNNMLVMGDGLLHGLVPYRDLFEQRGPALYVIFAIAHLMPGDPYTGLFIVEVLFIYASFFLVLRLARLVTLQKLAIPVALAATTITYGNEALRVGGSPEEFVIPMVLFILVTAYEVAIAPLSRGRLVMVGFATALCLWIKLILVGPLVGFLLVLIILRVRNGQFRKAISDTVWVGIGFSAVSLVVCIPFILVGAFRQLLFVYIKLNFASYGPSVQTSLPVRLLAGARTGLSQVFDHPFIAVFIALFMVLCLVVRSIPKRFSLFFAAMIATTFICVYGLRPPYPYYFTAMLPFAGIAAVFIFRATVNRRPQWLDNSLGWLVSGILCLSLFLGTIAGDSFVLTWNQGGDIVERFDRQMRSRSPEGFTILQFGAQGRAFYTYSGVVPNIRYFTQTNLDYPPMWEAQQKYIADGAVEYVIATQDHINKSFPRWKNTKFVPVSLPGLNKLPEVWVANYELIDYQAGKDPWLLFKRRF